MIRPMLVALLMAVLALAGCVDISTETKVRPAFKQHPPQQQPHRPRDR